jgi:hypothetical protein
MERRVCSSRPAVTTDTPSRTSFARWWWVLGVDRDHPGRPDQDVVDVGASVPKRDRVQHPPRRRLYDAATGSAETGFNSTRSSATANSPSAPTRHDRSAPAPSLTRRRVASWVMPVSGTFRARSTPRTSGSSELPAGSCVSPTYSSVRRAPDKSRRLNTGPTASPQAPDIRKDDRTVRSARRARRNLQRAEGSGIRPVPGPSARAAGRRWPEGPPGPPAARFIDTVQRVDRHWSARSGGAILGATVRPDPGGPR